MIRGLHFHERGQDDLFACVRGMVRVVALDRESGETFSEDIGEDNPTAIYIPGIRARLRGADGLPVPLPRDRGVRPGRSSTARHSLGRSARRRPVEHTDADPFAAGRRRRVLITGAGGQLGRALAERSPGTRWSRSGVPSGTWRCHRRVGSGGSTSCCTPLPGRTWTARVEPQEAAAVNVGGGERRSARCAARRLLLGLRLRRSQARAVPRRSDGPNPLSAYGRTKLHGEAAAGEQAWVVRSSWLFGGLRGTSC